MEEAPRAPAMAAAGDEPETVEVTLRAVGPSRPTTLRLPPLLSVGNTPYPQTLPLLPQVRRLRSLMFALSPPRSPSSADASRAIAVSQPQKRPASAWSCVGGRSRTKTTPKSTSAMGVGNLNLNPLIPSWSAFAGWIMQIESLLVHSRTQFVVLDFS